MAASKYTCRLLAYTITATNLGSCADSYMKSATRNKTTALIELTATVDAAGNVTAAFDSTSKSVQVLRLSSGPLSGSGAAFPPGSLAFPVSISVGAGETLASTDFGQQLGIDSNPITAAGPSVSFMPSTNIQASSPFTLSIPFSATSLTLAANSSNDNLIVLYRWMKVENDVVTYAMGIIPRSEVIISDSKVSFQTKKFGSFQIGISETKISAAVTAPTAEPPSMKADVSNPLVGNWGVCHEEDHYNAGGPPPSNTGGSSSGSTTGGPSTPPPQYTPMNHGLGSATANNGGLSASSMHSPSSVTGDGTKMFVADTANNRILVWNSIPMNPGQPADFALGQGSLQTNPAGTNATTLNAPQGVFSTGSKLIVADTGNNRVLIWNTMPTTSGQLADVVLGQPDFSTGGANAGGVSERSLSGPTAVYVDSGKIFVSDTNNNRVLIWNTPPTANNSPSDVVVGQTAFSSTVSSPVSVTSLNLPHGISVNNGNLVVADSGNNRVLVWASIPTSNGQNAAGIMGQTSASGAASGTSAGTMNYPLGIFSLGSQLYVADANNHRILVWDTIPTGIAATAANKVMGQSDFNSHTPSSYLGGSLDRPSGIFVGGTFVFVADYDHNRVGVWNHLPTSSFDWMHFGLGQPDGPNWDQGNTQVIPATCNANLSVSMAVESDIDSAYLMTVSIDGAAPVNTYGQHFAAGSSNSTLVFSMTAPYGRRLTLWAPPWCMFSNTSTQNMFGAFTLSSDDIQGTASCTASTGNIKLVCATDTAPPPPPPSSGGDGGGGGDSIGRIPGATYSAYDFVKFTSGTFNHIKRIYLSKNCTGTLTSTVSESGSYSLPPADVTGTIPIDLTVANKTAKIMTAAGIERANAEPQWNGCGFSDWVINSPKSLNNSECEKDAGVDHTRIKIEGTKMFFCRNRINGTSQNSSGAARPADCNNIDTTGYLIKE